MPLSASSDFPESMYERSTIEAKMNAVPIATARAVPRVVLSEHLVEANPRLSVYPALQTEQSGKREELYSKQNSLVIFRGELMCCVDISFESLLAYSAEKRLIQVPTSSSTRGCPFDLNG